MNTDAVDRLVAEARAEAMRDLRDALHGASAGVLGRLAVDLVPQLFRAGYDGELAATGDHWADAWARPRATGLPTFLVRVYRGAFSEDDARDLLVAMSGGHVTQSALAVISDSPLRPGVRTALGDGVPWLIDTDGLVNLMMNANLGITSHVFEVKTVNHGYFQ